MSNAAKRNTRELQNLTSIEIDSLKLKEIENINDQRRKKSEKVSYENTANRYGLLNKNKIPNSTIPKIDETNDYINLAECTSKKIKLKDFNLVKLIGKGSFGKVSNFKSILILIK